MNIKGGNTTEKHRVIYTTIETDMVSTANMVIDKLCVLSTRMVCRRIKDLYDMYVLAHVDTYTLEELLLIYEKTSVGKIMNPAYCLCAEGIPEMAHAYDKYIGISHKPVFEIILKDITGFVLPILAYIDGNEKNAQWNTDTMMWEIL
jgi:hypothetical protein